MKNENSNSEKEEKLSECLGVTMLFCLLGGAGLICISLFTMYVLYREGFSLVQEHCTFLTTLWRALFGVLMISIILFILGIRAIRLSK